NNRAMMVSVIKMWSRVKPPCERRLKMGDGRWERRFLGIFLPSAFCLLPSNNILKYIVLKLHRLFRLIHDPRAGDERFGRVGNNRVSPVAERKINGRAGGFVECIRKVLA